MPLIPFGEYRPDAADYEGQHSRNILNAVPHADGYGPWLDFKAVTSALPAACRGGFYALKNDGSIAVFAGTSTDLYVLNNTNSTWNNISSSGGYTALASNRNWSFAQFNSDVIAVQGNAVPQVYDLTSSSTFTPLGGSPPQADYVSVVNRFLVLSGLASPNVYRVQWSGLNAITTWDNVTADSNFQDMADGGLVRGVVGGDIGTIFQDQSIRQMIFQPGSSLIFGIDRITANDGLLASYSVISAGSRIFWLSPTGFKMMIPGLLPQPIGKERVDRTFLADLDQSNLQLMIGTADPRFPRVYWAYKSVNGPTGLFDKILTYDWVLDRWSLLEVSGEYIAPIAQPGLTLECVDAAYGLTGTWLNLSSISSAHPAVVTFGGNAPANGVGIQFNGSSGTLPAPFVAETTYYILNSPGGTSTCNLTTSGGVGAFVGTAINTNSSSHGQLQYQQISIDNLSVATFDTIAVGQLPSLGMFDHTHAQGYFNSTPIEATLETSEHGAAPRRIFIRGFRPITDAPGCFGSLSTRENEQTTPAYTSEQKVNAQGLVPQRKSTRYARGHVRIPAATTWTFASGVEPDISLEGQR